MGRTMDEEIESLNKNKTSDLVLKPTGERVIGCKWVLRIKDGIHGLEEMRYKARLLAKGFTQREGVYYTEIFSPVVKHTSIILILALTAMNDLELEQMDVKTPFLHGELEEEILMQQPEDYVEKGKEDHVCLLKRSLYGLK
uniref:Reverse transcriptase Ty1/copia-type domain-containing protein n=1 Tax=Cannabis sativa TaxID=3483 RepID=A0A803QIQ0_CANSA